MTREDIIRMAREAGIRDCICNGEFGCLERFAALVAAAVRKDADYRLGLLIQEEREACAKVCEDSVPTYFKNGERWLKGERGKPDVRLKDIAPNLEAAWEAEQLLKNGSVLESYTVQHQCAAAIRARGQT